MKTSLISVLFVCIVSIFFFSQCNENAGENQTLQNESRDNFGGFGSQVEWGEHLVTVSACHDCHSPKKMTNRGPQIDSALLLSGHPAQLPPPDVDRKDLESKGFVLTSDLTSWVGPWGISYTANLTSDSTGIGNWKEEQFMYAIREGKLKGLPGSRVLLPPMPWDMYKHMTDDELKAIFAYLKTTRPVKNVVPPPAPPVLAPH